MKSRYIQFNYYSIILSPLVITQIKQIISMSIYSGFATRNQESYYDHILYNVLSTILVRLIKFYRRQHVEENTFQKIIHKQEKILRKMEKRKYLEPKYADLLQHFLASFEPFQEDDDDESSHQPTVKNQNNQLHRTFSLLDREMHQLTQEAHKVIGNFSKQKSQKKLSKIDQIVPRPSKRKKSKKVTMKSYVDLWQVKHQKMPQLPSLQPIQHNITKNNFRQPSEQKYIENDLSRRGHSKLLSQRKVDKNNSPSNKTIIRPHQAFRTNTFFRRDKFE